jgi:two-component system, OmpR family, response regulator
MKTENNLKLFLVDDDKVFLKALEIEFNQYSDFAVRTFATGELCLESLNDAPDLIILDYHLDSIDRDAKNGMETLDKIKTVNSEIPVIILSSQDKIDIAINCMHHKASDYVVKSETAFVRLQKIISTIIDQKKMEKQLHWYMEKM